MAKTTIMNDNFKNFITVAKIKVANLNAEVYEDGKEDQLDNLNYWRGKLDGLEFAASFGDDFFLLNLAELLRKEGYKDASKYLKSLVTE